MNAPEPKTPIERVAEAAHHAWCRHHDLDPVPWNRLRPRDRTRWVEVAEAAVGQWALERDTIIRRRDPTRPARIDD